MSRQPEALRLADLLRTPSLGTRQTLDEAATELRRLHQHELALIDWFEKTDWVRVSQVSAQPGEFGRHLADVIKQRFDRLHALNQELVEALKGGPSIEHVLPFNNVCTCSQCEFVRLRRAAIAKAEGGAT